IDLVLIEIQRAQGVCTIENRSDNTRCETFERVAHNKEKKDDESAGASGAATRRLDCFNS
uniref:hypothetical protein n=1 Tax=Prevotella sp. TaxID=59823 RepID=UPI003FEF6EA6